MTKSPGKLDGGGLEAKIVAEFTCLVEGSEVELTDEVWAYIRAGVGAVEVKLLAGKDVFESDLVFIENVKAWVGMVEEWRDKFVSVEVMLGSEEIKNAMKTAEERDISLEQWLDLLHVAEVMVLKRGLIDGKFAFYGSGVIWVVGELNFAFTDGLKRLPEGLNVWELNLRNCVELTSFPNDLEVRSVLYLSKNLSDQVKKDAKRLLDAGQIGGIKYQ